MCPNCSEPCLIAIGWKVLAVYLNPAWSHNTKSYVLKISSVTNIWALTTCGQFGNSNFSWLMGKCKLSTLIPGGRRGIASWALELELRQAPNFQSSEPRGTAQKGERQALRQQGSGILASPKGLRENRLLEETHWCYWTANLQIWKRIGPDWNHSAASLQYTLTLSLVFTSLKTQ